MVNNARLSIERAYVRVLLLLFLSLDTFVFSTLPQYTQLYKCVSVYSQWWIYLNDRSIIQSIIAGWLNIKELMLVRDDTPYLSNGNCKFDQIRSAICIPDSCKWLQPEVLYTDKWNKSPESEFKSNLFGQYPTVCG